MKSARFDIFPDDHDGAARRVEARMALRLPAMLYVEGQASATAIVTDVTTRGCRIETDRRLDVAASITLMIADSTLIGGRVAWRDEESCGVDFCARLMPKAITRMLINGA